MCCIQHNRDFVFDTLGFLGGVLLGSKGTGPSFGVNYQTDTNFSFHSLLGAAGLSFGNRLNMEINLLIPDLRATSVYSASGFLNVSHRLFYLGAGLIYTSLMSNKSWAGRAGIVLGPVDVSVYGSANMTSGATTAYGASLRGTF